MKKQFKLFSFLLTFFLIVVSLTVTSRVNAASTSSDNGKGIWTPTKEETINVYGMSHSAVWGTANNNTKQHINVLSMKTDGYSSKLVTWAMDNGKNYQRCTLDKLAEDYEAKHPGWLVVGGINGDQYTVGFGSDLGAGSSYFCPQTYYPLIMDNESRIPLTVQKDYTMHVGFANNGSENSFVHNSPVKCFVLTIVDEHKNEIAKYTIDNINTAPTEDQITVWSTHSSDTTANKYVNQAINSDKNIYIVENPELAYMNSTVEYANGINSIFGRGIISSVKTGNVTLVNNQFAIETSNTEVQNALSEGTRIIVDAEYENDDLNNCEASAGFHSVHRMNGADAALVHTGYDGTKYSRSIFGKKADGTYVLLTVDGATDPQDYSIRYTGMNFDECNATLKHYGVVEAYQQDGGGSVTSLYRDANGKFVISNYPRDGVRANLTGLLFVIRDPRLEISETTHNSVTLTLNNELDYIGSTIQNVIVKHNGKDYPLVNGSVTINDLEEDTTYDFEFTYDVVSEDKITSTKFNIAATTKKFDGVQGAFRVDDISKNSFKIYKEQNEYVQDVIVNVDGVDYNMNDDSIVINELIDSTNYKIVIKYNVVDKETNKKYSRTYETDVTTTSYEIPSIPTFEIDKLYEDRVRLNYKYVDSDGLVTEAYILCNDVRYDVTTKTGIQTIKDLDLEHQEYKIQLVVTYVVGTTAKNVKSEIITVGTNNPIISHNITYNLDGGTNNELNPSSYVEGEEVILKEATKEGYKFLGWYIGETKVTSISPEAKEDIELTAKWEKIKEKYQITYILNGGTNNASNPSTYEEGEKVILKEATKEGYKFLGWYKDGELVTEVKEGNVTVEARFEEIKNQDSEKKGCNCKKTIEMVITLTSAVTLLAFVLRKKH